MGFHAARLNYNIIAGQEPECVWKRTAVPLQIHPITAESWSISKLPVGQSLFL